MKHANHDLRHFKRANKKKSTITLLQILSNPDKKKHKKINLLFKQCTFFFSNKSSVHQILFVYTIFSSVLFSLLFIFLFVEDGCVCLAIEVISSYLQTIQCLDYFILILFFETVLRTFPRCVGTRQISKMLYIPFVLGIVLG